MMVTSKKLMLVVLVLLAALMLGVSTQIRESKIFKAVNESFDSTRPALNAQSFEAPGSQAEIQKLKLAFDFVTRDPHFAYGNLFQTSDSQNAVRMEFQPPHKLVIILGGDKLLTLSETMEAEKNYSVSLDFERGKTLKVVLNSLPVIDLDKGPVLNSRVDLSHTLIGTGLASQRPLSGSVSNFVLAANYQQYSKTAVISRYLFATLCGLLFFLSLRPRSFSSSIATRYAACECLWAVSVVIQGIAIFFVATCSAIVFYAGPQNFGLAKWVPYLVLPVSALAAIIISRVRRTLPAIAIAGAAAVLSTYATTIIWPSLLALSAYPSPFLVIILLSTAGILASNFGQTANEKISLASRIYLAVIMCIAWCASIDLFYLETISNIVDAHYAISIATGFVMMRILFSANFDIRFFRRRNFTQPPKIVILVTNICACTAFLWMSFRYDSLFIAGSEYHWEYFVGAVRGIQSGGMLWWDVPSQYGFLNVLLASLLPFRSAWQSFYIFQSLLLALVSVGIYFSLTRMSGSRYSTRLAIFFLVFFSVFYADPHLIGPSPFPSSSVLRFFCCYLSIVAICRFPSYGRPQGLAMGGCWLLSLFWSAESAVYGTAIYLFLLVSLVISANKKIYADLLTTYLVIALSGLATAAVLVISIYKIKIGMAPDIKMYFEYALGYAGGFGYIPLKLTGPGNLLLLAFLALCGACAMQLRSPNRSDSVVAPLAVMAGCIWGISTYYLGRPVPQNITAMLPLIVLIMLYALLSGKEMRVPSVAFPLAAIAIPIFFLVFMPVISTTWWAAQIATRSVTMDISQRLRPASPVLIGVLASLDRDKKAAFTYYGNDAAPPIFEADGVHYYEDNFLPAPVQLLETPISDTRREIFIRRFLCRKKAEKGFVVSSNEPDIVSRLNRFLPEIRKYYRLEKIITSEGRTIRLFSEFRPVLCSSQTALTSRVGANF